MNRLFILCLLTAVFSLSAGCAEMVPGFKGTLELKPTVAENSGQLLRTYFAFQKPLPKGQRLVAFDCFDPHSVNCIAVLVLVADEPVRGKVRFTGEPDARARAWIVDPREIASVEHPDDWPDALRRYCFQLATGAEAERRRAVRLTGFADFGNRGTTVPSEYDVAVSLRSEDSRSLAQGEYARFVEFHPEYPFLEVAGTLYFLATGKLPI